MMPQRLPDPWEPIVERIADRVVQRLQEEAERKPAPRLLTPEEAARHLGRSKRWLRTATARGEIKPVEIEGARPRYDRKVLDRWIDERG